MATQSTELNFNYYHKVLETLFPNYRYNRQLLRKPNTEFVLDVMQLFIEYYLSNFGKNIPLTEELANSEQEQKNEAQIAKPISYWEVLANCNGILRRFDLGLGLFNAGDIVCPSNDTVNKIVCILTLCVHIHDLDFTEQFGQIQQILCDLTDIKDYENLVSTQRELEVEAECLQHQLAKLKTKEELDHIENMQVAEATRIDARKKQLSEEFATQQALLLQREHENERLLQAVKTLEDNIVDQNLVETLKSELETLQLKKQSQTIEEDNLVNKSNNTIVVKHLLEFELIKMNNLEDTLKQYEDYQKVADDLTESIKQQRGMNTDLLRDIDDCNKETNLIKNGQVNKNDFKQMFLINKAKITLDLLSEDKKLEELKGEINKELTKKEILLTDIKNKCVRSESLISSIKTMDKEVRDVMNTILQETLKKFEEVNMKIKKN